MPLPRPVPAQASNGLATGFSTTTVDANQGSDGTRVPGIRRSSLPPLSRLPQLPQGSSQFGPPSYPRHDSGSSAAATVTRTMTTTTTSPTTTHSRIPTTNPRRRRAEPSPWSPEAPLEWGDDSPLEEDHELEDLSALAAFSAVSDNLLNNDDQYLSAFAENDFSSPSNYPSFFEPPTASGARNPWRQVHTAAQASTASSATAHPHQPNHRRSDSPAPSRTTTQLSNASSSGSRNPRFSDDLFGGEHLPDTPFSSFSDTMPPVLRKRNLTADAAQHDASASGSHDYKRRRTSNAGPGLSMRRPSAHGSNTVVIKDLDEDEDLFGETPVTRDAAEDVKHEYTTIDLTGADEVPEDLSKPEDDNRVKLATFQCAICMDDAATLTVTTCGHLFCAHCLHQSLAVESTKGKCPICRGKIAVTPRASYRTKGFWHLELKLMTATRKGKRKAEALS